ncbi:hypothetical protein HYH03_004143 [Edaphochlamys debaryana]|uniref:Glycosyl transferase family 1 domain-containing protein n=1 Tax=Edaphochlamys debaryana TaxID=47281 RepID=A0A836C3K4_9CHLO|nr:hypothetical protein HYH03_004143 [Edaphochlamys debaryana]|eukprot:KAG2497877.1 hypothetical protein HYH03_004143 [Edaphochlamys debaryana]
MASTLASAGHDTHVVSLASRGKVLLHAGTQGLLPQLSFARPGVVSWAEGRVRHHVVLTDQPGPSEPAPAADPADPGAAAGGLTAAVAARVAACVRDLTACGSPAARAWVILDADESQKPLRPTAPAASAPTSSTSASASSASLFSHVVSACPPGRCLALVQNVHFLPLGPSGSGARSGPQREAWRGLGGVVAVSGFVEGYLREHWPREGQEEGEGQGPFMPDIRVVPLAAWGAFGEGPFPDLAATARPLLHAWREAQRGRAEAAGQGPASAGASRGPDEGTGAGAPSSPASGPCVQLAVLKVTPEKGLALVLELARRLQGRGVRFRCVAGDPAVFTALRSCGAPVALVEPQPGVEPVLRGCVGVLAPSLWLEAWGMVVTEALLRGLPVLVSDLGGLPEAGLGLCPAVPVSPIEIPPGPDGVPDWAARRYPAQDVGAWEEALLSLLMGGDISARAADSVQGLGGDAAGMEDAWERVSVCGRQAAQVHVARRQEYLNEFVEWLGGLAAAQAKQLS